MMDRRRRVGFGIAFVLGTGLLLLALSDHRPARVLADAGARKPAAAAAPAISGAELFRREWIPNDPRSHGGDGLGPLFNDTSCVACHNQGGPGGGGSAAKNVELLSAVMLTSDDAVEAVLSGRADELPGTRAALFAHRLLNNVLTTFHSIAGDDKEAQSRNRKQRERIVEMHPGFRNANGIVLHRFGTDDEYPVFRIKSQFAKEVVGELSILSPGGSSEDEPRSDSDDETDDDRATSESTWTYDALLTFADWLVSAPGDEIPRGIVAFTAPKSVSKKNSIIREIMLTKGLLAFEQISGTPFAAMMGANFDLEIEVAALKSARNPTALFGAGLIDSIPASVIEAGAKQSHKGFFNVSGRVSRLPDGGVGRFGWKGQTATLREFAMTACAVELGLHVPEHPQSPLPYKPEENPAGFDMSQVECDALVKFLRDLPPPARQASTDPVVGEYVAAGGKLFEQVGCATCHTQKLGDVDGIYSDLLLHDLGPDLSDNGVYGGVLKELPDAPSAEEAAPPIAAASTGDEKTAPRRATVRTARPAASGEWRTPPLWGVRDSAPYLHDGRASTLEQAIAFHGGEAARSTILYFKLSPPERMKLVAFLKTLGAPGS